MGHWRPISRALYSATLLEHGSVNENALGRIWFCGEINTLPTPAMILPLRHILDAPSKNICHTSSSEVRFENLIWNIFMKFWAFWNRMSSQEICKRWPLTVFWGTKSISYWDRRRAHLANLEFSDPGFVMRRCKGFTLETVSYTHLTLPTIYSV